MEHQAQRSTDDSSRDLRLIARIARIVTVLGVAMLISAFVNLAQAPAVRAMARGTIGFPAQLSDLPPFLAFTFLVTQNWLLMVVIQFILAAVVLTAGVGLLRQRHWGRLILEGLSWMGLLLLAAPAIWIARWTLSTPNARILGLEAGLQTLPSAVGRPVTMAIQLFVAAPLPFFAWTPAADFLGAVASVGVPIACGFLIAFLRRSTAAFYRGVHHNEP